MAADLAAECLKVKDRESFLLVVVEEDSVKRVAVGVRAQGHANVGRPSNGRLVGFGGKTI